MSFGVRNAILGATCAAVAAVTCGPASSPAAVRAFARGGATPCPARSVFLRLFAEIRGYPLDARGNTTACQRIAGPKTLLRGNGNGYGAIAAGRDGTLHALAFQSNGIGGLLAFAAASNGDVAPLAAANVDQDHVALATARRADFVVANQGYQADACWYVVPAGASQASRSNCDAHVDAIYAMTCDDSGDLFVVGFDRSSGTLRIDEFGEPASPSPVLLRTVAGPATGLPAAGSSYFDNSFALASEPGDGDLAVYVGGPTLGGTPPPGVPRVEVFAASASGNVAPVRTLGGSRTNLPPASFAADVIAFDGGGRLYAATQTPEILVFGARAAGNVVPERTIGDASAPRQRTAVGITVRE